MDNMESIKTLQQVTKFEDFNLHESFRAYMIYEEIMKEHFKPDSIKNILIYFYSNVMACNRDLVADFDEFIDWLDTNPTMVEQFTTWLINTAKATTTKNQDGEEADKGDPFHGE